MKAQSLIQLHEWEPAVHSSLHAVHESARIWAPAFQTLGRAYLGKGLVFQATAAFSKAFHLDPSDKEVLSDLNWASRFGHSRFFVLFFGCMDNPRPILAFKWGREALVSKDCLVSCVKNH